MAMAATNVNFSQQLGPVSSHRSVSSVTLTTGNMDSLDGFDFDYDNSISDLFRKDNRNVKHLTLDTDNADRGKLLIRLIKKFSKLEFEQDKIGFDDRKQTNYFYYKCNQKTRVIKSISKKELKTIYSTVNAKHLHTRRTNDLLLVIDTTGIMTPQIGFANMAYSIFNTTMDTTDKIAKLFDVVKQFFGSFTGISTLLDKTSKIFTFIKNLDYEELFSLCINLYLSIGTAYASGVGFVQFVFHMFKLVRFLHKTMKNTNLITHAPVISDDDDWHTENMSLEALMAGLVYFGVSNNLISALKDFSLLIGKRVHASHTFQSIFSALHNIINGFLDFITDKIGLERFIIPIKKVVKYLFEPFSYYQHLMEVVEQYTEWIRDQSTLHNPVFRNKVITTAKALKCNTGFLDWIRNNDNKHFIATWNAYNDQLYKMANTYTTSEREEPICIVLDGPPGCGKSVLLNKVVESLKALDHTVYTHTVPPVNTSKDFYDDYLNQDVFVMDDVGQQGKSQWRSIINFVSPVKYPLDCAQADKKNTKFFNSKILICTTNAFEHLCGFTAQDAISTPEALFRRVHLINVARISETSYQGFSQQLIYKKYDYVTSKNWKNELLAHNARLTKWNTQTRPLPLALTLHDDLNTGVKWVLMLIKHLQQTETDQRLLVSNTLNMDDIVDCINNPEKVSFDRVISTRITQDDSRNSTGTPQVSSRVSTQTPQAGLGEYLDNWMRNDGWDAFNNGRNIFMEFVTNTSQYLREFLFDMFDRLQPILNRYLIKLGSIARDISGPLFEGVTFIGEMVSMFWTWLKDKYGQCSKKVKNLFHESRDFQDAEDRMSYDILNEFVTDLPYYPCGPVGIIEGTDCALRELGNGSLFEGILTIVAYGLITTTAAYGIFETLTDTPQTGESQSWLSSWFNRKKESALANDDFLRSKEIVEKNIGKLERTLNIEHAENIAKKHMRILVDQKTGKHTCVLVSGKRILTNSHFGLDDMIVDVYRSIEHFKNKHKEMEATRVRVVKNYLNEDVCTAEFLDVIPLYPIFKRFGSVNDLKHQMAAFISPYGVIPMLPYKTFKTNEGPVNYKYKTTEWFNTEHPTASGIVYPISGYGLCGSLTFSEGRAIGTHVSGNGTEGFARMFPQYLCEELTEFFGSSPKLVGSFDLSDKIYPEFSGTRLYYPDDQKSEYMGRANGNSNLVPTELNATINASTRELMDKLRQSPIQVVEPGEFYLKAPPDFSDDPKGLMKKLANKSFQLQGKVTVEELNFIGDYIESILPDKLEDLTDDETSFGGEFVPAFNKKSSNGFGVKVGKDSVLDFEQRRLTDYGHGLLARFKENAKNGNFDPHDFVCKETFKDELRKPSKIKSPRTFRVMPFPHIWWTKKTCGQLLNHFKKNIHRFGVCVGFNPYTDFHELRKQLETCIITGDADYGEWDGHTMALIAMEIKNRILKIYAGQNADVIEYVFATMMRSFTLISDDLYATTHSLPSGTWLTLLLNCLINKALTALTIFRSNPNPTIEDVAKVIDYVCGDDNIFGNNRPGLIKYDLFNVKEVAESLGMVVTNGDKTEITKSTQDLDKLTFLKRSFRYHPVLNRWVGALSIDTLINTLQWYDTSSTAEYSEILLGKSNAVLIEAYNHSVACYEIFRDFLKENGITYGLFGEEDIIRILNKEDGYAIVTALMGKNFVV